MNEGRDGQADGDLVRSAQRGSSSAFAELVRRHQDRVYNACYRICGQEADALDVTQTAFLRALEALQQFEQRSSFSTWVFRIAMNLAISLRRKMRMSALPEQVRAAGAAFDPSDAAERAEECSLLALALSQIDSDFRVAVVLKDIEGMDYAEISDILDVPLGTVKSRIHRGRMLLREVLTRVPAAQRGSGNMSET